ncbi:MAG: hypothetical protein U0T56_09950 [Ferruginibacter sp.]
MADRCFTERGRQGPLDKPGCAFRLTKLEAGRTINYNAFPGNGVYLVNISGKVQVNDTALHKRDAMGITESDQFTIVAEEDSELLVIEVPMR